LPHTSPATDYLEKSKPMKVIFEESVKANEGEALPEKLLFLAC
jgi:hypothetical protein